MPDRLTGDIDRWTNKKEFAIKILWLDDSSNSVEGLPALLASGLQMKLEKFQDGRTAPKAKGSSWRQAYAQAARYGPYAAQPRTTTSATRSTFITRRATES